MEDTNAKQLILDLKTLQDTSKVPNLTTLVKYMASDRSNTTMYYHFRVLLTVLDNDTGDTTSYQVQLGKYDPSLGECLKEQSMLVQYLRTLEIVPLVTTYIEVQKYSPSDISDQMPTGWSTFSRKQV